MKIITRAIRLIRINFILMRYNIDEIVLGTHWFAPLRFLIFLNPFYWTLDKNMSRGERIRRALEDLGPIFVKVGQIVSTRRDFIPDDIANELAKLQDQVPPFSGSKAQSIIEKALGCPIEETFLSFDANALASASIAQVHAATLLNGDEVAVKVLRPHIRTLIDRDLDLLLSLAKAAERYFNQARDFKPIQMVEEIAQTLHDELDLLREGANASQLKRNFANTRSLYVPTIYWDASRINVLVMERIYGIPIHHIAQLKASGANMQKIAERCIEIFFTQVFRDSFFHADLHPGNIFVASDNWHDPIIKIVDFGIVGSLSQNDQRYLAENMIAFFKRDYQRVAELHIACGWLPPDTRVDQFEGAIRAVSEPIFERPLKDISFGKLLLRLFQVARRFHINIQPQLILLQKTLLSIEGLSRQLAPELDLWTAATPHIEKWLKKQVGTRAFLKRLRNNFPTWSEQLPEMPGLLYEVLKESRHQQEKFRFEQIQAPRQIASKKHHWCYFLMGAGITLFISATWYILMLR
ncbi:MAG: ubiquinone biosynthesis regulatory protein kinase UbiB [Gammaproteobacteria bacterium RIFCSPHIGHO2_12_FULL_45_12]|nr:MAG: ubiquinone biosynthesis regulatory protein kinase UbiB [Gammaproteobacteria bacterium RIFCSPHIGHO2_12_FULL_45_12]